MRLLFIGLLFVFPAYVAAQPTSLLTDMSARLHGFVSLPFALREDVPARLKIISLPQGALARYNPRTDTFEISKKHYRQDADNPYLASCLFPLLVHESVHARLYKQAQSLGFYWPVTLQDEVWAWYYQLVAEREITPALPTTVCKVWWPELNAIRQAFLQQDEEAFARTVYEHYSQYAGADLPPPPFTKDEIARVLENHRLTFYAHTYRLNSRHLSSATFWIRGDNWLRLKKSALKNMAQDSNYQQYVNQVKHYQHEMLEAFNKQKLDFF